MLEPPFQLIRNTCEKVYWCGVVFTRWYPKDQSVVISQIKSLNPKNGNATRCMEYLVDSLRRYGIKRIELVAMPIPGTVGPGAEKLMQWYKRFGFVVTDYTMVGGHLYSAEMELSFLPSKLMVKP